MSKTLELIDSFPIKTNINNKNKKMVLSDSGDVKVGSSLICNVTASHAGTLINNRIYPPDEMQKGIRSWTSPYKKPVLVNHDSDSSPVGRVIKAKYIKTQRGMSGDQYKPLLNPSDGYGYTDLTVKITDPEAIQKILDGRYETVSVRMNTDHAYCSICNSDWTDEPCEHDPGKKYDGKLAYITTGKLNYSEVSFVNIPADQYARVEGSVLEDGDCGSVDMKVYANNAEEKFLCNLGDNECNNLYDYLRGEHDEEEDAIVHLINNESKKCKKSKEDQMSKEKELTRDQLMEMDSVKELVKEAKDKASKECEDQLIKLKEECEKSVKNSDNSKINDELESTKVKLNAVIDAQTALSREKDALIAEKNQLKNQLDSIESERKTILDENVSLNSELHKLNAERLFDLKSELKKPDVSEIKTLEDRAKKVDEFAQRSLDSLKDQISDLIVEKNASPAALKSSVQVNNPGVVHEDSGEPKKHGKSEKDDSKKATLNRLFQKGSKKQ